MTALGLPYPTIVGTVAGGEWASTVMDRVVADGRYGVRLGQSPDDAADELRACIDAACAADPFLRDHPATVEITGRAVRISARPGRTTRSPLSLAGGRGGGRRAGARRSSASRTAPTCACSSGSGTRRASSSGPGDVRAGPRRRRARAARRGRGVRPGPRRMGGRELGAGTLPVVSPPRPRRPGGGRGPAAVAPRRTGRAVGVAPASSSAAASTARHRPFARRIWRGVWQRDAEQGRASTRPSPRTARATWPRSAG